MVSIRSSAVTLGRDALSPRIGGFDVVQVVFMTIASLVLGSLLVVSAYGSQLPPEVLLDQLVLRTEGFVQDEDDQRVIETIEEIITLQQEHEIELPLQSRFRLAEAARFAGRLDLAREFVIAYLTVVSRHSESYEGALTLLENVDRLLERRDGPDCDAGERPCWVELSNQSGCRFWWEEGATVPPHVPEWTGTCTSGLAHGPGTLILIWEWGPSDNNRQEQGGTMRLGRREGRWDISLQRLRYEHGPYVNGKRHGQWIWEERHSGYTEQGPYVNGERHGRWVMRWRSGEERECLYVDGRAMVPCD